MPGHANLFARLEPLLLYCVLTLKGNNRTRALLDAVKSKPAPFLASNVRTSYQPSLVCASSAWPQTWRGSSEAMARSILPTCSKLRVLGITSEDVDEDNLNTFPQAMREEFQVTDPRVVFTDKHFYHSAWPNAARGFVDNWSWVEQRVQGESFNHNVSPPLAHAKL
ncbi:hypothetical protein DFH06DRAFT_1437516 [Mycena polygramma]|nr:hypothetical protein DFH06DRAFT_1437516 [Mycena polygramma]